MESPTLNISVCDTVSVQEGTRRLARGVAVSSPYFRPQITMTMDKDVAWAPARSRAPSVTIEMDFFEAATG